MCDCVCCIVQILHFAGQAMHCIVCVLIPVYRCCMACEVVTDHRDSVGLVWRVIIHMVMVDVVCNQK